MMFNPHAVTTLREVRLLSKSELAKRAEITASYMSELEAGNRMNPSLDVVRRLAETLDVDAAAFYVPRRIVKKFARGNPGEVMAMLREADEAEAVAS